MEKIKIYIKDNIYDIFEMRKENELDIFYKNNKTYTGIIEIYGFKDELELIGELKNGLKIKEWRYYYPNGNLEFIENYYLGKRNGKYEVFYETGERKITGLMKDDLKVGHWKWFKLDGTIEKEQDYERGKIKIVIPEIKEEKNVEKKFLLKKTIEQTYDSLRDWLLPLLRKDDKIIFPKEEFLERVKLFDEAEKLRTFNVIKLAVEHDNYCVKFEEDKTIRGYEVIKAFGEMLGITVEEEVVENVEETEVEEEKKLTPQQLRKKNFLERMKKSEEEK